MMVNPCFAIKEVIVSRERLKLSKIECYQHCPQELLQRRSKYVLSREYISKEFNYILNLVNNVDNIFSS